MKQLLKKQTQTHILMQYQPSVNKHICITKMENLCEILFELTSFEFDLKIMHYGIKMIFNERYLIVRL